jgi:hypothetical protein
MDIGLQTTHRCLGCNIISPWIAEEHKTYGARNEIIELNAEQLKFVSGTDGLGSWTCSSCLLLNNPHPTCQACGETNPNFQHYLMNAGQTGNWECIKCEDEHEYTVMYCCGELSTLIRLAQQYYFNINQGIRQSTEQMDVDNLSDNVVNAIVDSIPLLEEELKNISVNCALCNSSDEETRSEFVCNKCEYTICSDCLRNTIKASAKELTVCIHCNAKESWKRIA